MTADNDESSKLFATYFADRTILVADPNRGSRTGLARTIVDLGGKTSKVIMQDNFTNAKQDVIEKQPEVIIAEYNFPDGGGLELSQETRAYPNQQNKLFVLVTSDSSQSSVAQAAEEDVDVYLLKPYNLKYFKERLLKVIVAKMRPTEYMIAIEAGKDLLKKQQVDEALSTFTKALTLDPKPALACYYKGQTEILKSILTEAESSYFKGLEFNDIHYKCLTGLFDLFLSQNRLPDAYDIAKKLTKTFPATPKRLAQILGLAIQTSNFSDVERYYEFFKNVEVRNEELIRYTCAALIICAKYFLRHGEPDRAYNLLNNASVSAGGRPGVLREIVQLLVSNGRMEDAKATMKRFPPSSKNDNHFIVAEFLMTNYETRDPKQSLILALQLIRKKIEDPTLYFWAIWGYRKSNELTQAEGYLAEAIRKWPSQQKYLNSAMVDETEDESEKTDGDA